MAHRFVHKKAWHRARAGVAGGVLLLLAGCASNQPTSSAAKGPGDETINSGLAALMRDSDIDTGSLPSGPPQDLTDTQLAALVQRSALDLEKVFAEQAQRANRPRAERPIADATEQAANQGANQSAPVQPTPSKAPAFTLSDVAAAPDAAVAPNGETPSTSPGDTVASAAATPDAASTANGQDAGTPAPVNPALASLAPEDRLLVETASRIIDLMKPPALPDGSSAPGMNEALALAAIESVKPGTLASIDDPNGVLAKGLAPERYAALREARDRVALNPAAAHGAAKQALTSLAPSLQMSSVRLCTRVMGFGRYDAYASTDFVAGRSIRAIVYAQIDGFAPRPAKNSDPVQPNVPLDQQKTVDLSQSLTLFHDTGTMQAWHRPFQRVMETSRDVRQDFYLIQQIELPKELPIGEYRLKVTVRDNTTGAEHEAFIPLRVVAAGSTMTDAR